MRRIMLWALWVVAGCAGLGGDSAALRNPSLDPFLGTYRGSFESALSEDPDDDLNHNPCRPDAGKACRIHHEPLADIILALRRQTDGTISTDFYRSRVALTEGRSLDLLGQGCGTRLGTPRRVVPATNGHVVIVPLTAENRLCLGKLRPVSDHELRLQLSRDDQGGRSVRVIIDKAVRDDNYLYVVEDGVRRRVRIDLDNTLEENSQSRYRVCIENDLGEYERCVLTDRRFRSFALPVPVPGGAGINYTWWQELEPRLRSTRGRYSVEQYVGTFEPLTGTES